MVRVESLLLYSEAVIVCYIGIPDINGCYLVDGVIQVEESVSCLHLLHAYLSVQRVSRHMDHNPRPLHVKFPQPYFPWCLCGRRVFLRRVGEAYVKVSICHDNIVEQ